MLGPLTRLQCCPPTCGGAAAVIVSENFARRKGIRADIVIRGQAMRTDFPSTFEENSLIKVVGADMSAVAAHSVYEQSGIRSEERRVGKECVSTCRSVWLPSH